MVKLLLLFLIPFYGYSLEPYLKLTPIFTGDFPLYPGQEAYIGYRYEYNTSIDLTEEELPLLRAEGFKKIGEKQIDHNEVKGITTTQIIQKIQAVKPGRYEFPPSIVKGIPYTTDRLGNKILGKPLQASVKALSFLVSPFPGQDQPSSFNGAIGDFKISSKLESHPEVAFGGRINLRFTVTGKGEFESVKPPQLCCQPGFAGFFTFSDLPPKVEEKEGEKSFIIDLFAKESRIKAIPEIQFSAFDPKSATYKTSKTAAIPIQVLKRELPKLPQISLSKIESTLQLKPFQPFPTNWQIQLLPLIFFGLAGLICYVHLRYFSEVDAKMHAPSKGERLLQEAERKSSYQILLKALRALMKEKKVHYTKLEPMIREVERKWYFEKEPFDPTFIKNVRGVIDA